MKVPVKLPLPIRIPQPLLPAINRTSRNTPNPDPLVDDFIEDLSEVADVLDVVGFYYYGCEVGEGVRQLMELGKEDLTDVEIRAFLHVEPHQYRQRPLQPLHHLAYQPQEQLRLVI